MKAEKIYIFVLYKSKHNKNVFSCSGNVYICMYILWHINPLLGKTCETEETNATARQQLRKYATLLEPLLGSGPRTTIRVLSEAVFFICPLHDYIIRQTKLSVVIRYSKGTSITKKKPKPLPFYQRRSNERRKKQKS
jgi:hypothetical protein